VDYAEGSLKLVIFKRDCRNVISDNV